MRRPREKKQVDPRPVMPRGDTEFEEKRIECEFTLLYNQISKMSFATFGESCDFIFRQGYFMGKIAAKRESETQ